MVLTVASALRALTHASRGMCASLLPAVQQVGVSVLL